MLTLSFYIEFELLENINHLIFILQKINVFRLKSSIKVIIYLYSRFQYTSSSPQRSEQTNSNSFVAFQDCLEENTSLLFLLTTHVYTHLPGKISLISQTSSVCGLVAFSYQSLCPKYIAQPREILDSRIEAWSSIFNVKIKKLIRGHFHLRNLALLPISNYAQLVTDLYIIVMSDNYPMLRRFWWRPRT